MRNNVDISSYSAKSPSRIKPEQVDLGDLPPIQKPQKHAATSQVQTGIAQNSPFPSLSKNSTTRTERISERTDFRTENRTVGLPSKRRTKRYSFEFFDDQLSKLRQLKYKAELAGDNLSLSEIVRTALDDYLTKQNV